jgi:hypothetical protein
VGSERRKDKIAKINDDFPIYDNTVADKQWEINIIPERFHPVSERMQPFASSRCPCP